jgi:DNA-directed RNA polymerase subunit M/transcription elongation factor TFIIS
MSAPDTTDQSVIVCPHCGHRHDDSQDWSMYPVHVPDWGAGDCDKCGETFEWSRTAVITYTTSKEVQP